MRQSQLHAFCFMSRMHNFDSNISAAPLLLSFLLTTTDNEDGKKTSVKSLQLPVRYVVQDLLEVRVYP